MRHAFSDVEVGKYREIANVMRRSLFRLNSVNGEVVAPTRFVPVCSTADSVPGIWARTNYHRSLPSCRNARARTRAGLSQREDFLLNFPPKVISPENRKGDGLSRKCRNSRSCIGRGTFEFHPHGDIHRVI